MAREGKGGGFKLEVPLDASGVDGFKPDQAVKIAVLDRAGRYQAETVELDPKGRGTASFGFKENPGAVRVLVGPANASDEELQALQTISTTVSGRQWQVSRDLKLQPILISSYYWYWWLWWCRDFTIRGRVLCPDGTPVPGARVCAFDADWWWWWSSKQEVGCATTDATGSFEIKFRWCCGYWPWWWWKLRTWQFEPFLADRIVPVLQRHLKLGAVDPSPQPDLAVFDRLLAEREASSTPGFEVEGVVPSGERETFTRDRVELGLKGSLDLTVLPDLRERLLKWLPVVPELDRLRLWPWWPWYPWWDCTPDIIFRVTQDCETPGTVIVDEGWWDVRWNIPTTLDVTLTANGNACCIPQDPDPQEDCILVDSVCGNPINLIGGNAGAPLVPAGYLRPGLISIHGDRPYGGTLRIGGQIGDPVDYYDFQWSADNGATWNDMPSAAVGNVYRTYWIPATSDFPTVPFLDTVDGRLVYETRQHYEATHDPLTWGNTRFWLSVNYFLLIRWLTQNNFADGTYHLRARGWDLAGVNLVNPRILLVCSTETENRLIVTIDNRVEGPGSGHPTSPDHPCGSGTVHTCTQEPDTDFMTVRINGVPIGPCTNFDATGGGSLEIDFLAHDPDGHLAYYSLLATYGENLAINLLSVPGATLAPGPAGPVPPAAQVGQTYALARGQGATAPTWHGGTLRLTIPDLRNAFPQTCCYQLELRAYKRTIVNCNHGFHSHRNLSELSFAVMV